MIRIVFLIFIAAAANAAKILELGESQLHGKKDQPEAITFISRARLDQDVKPVDISFKSRIGKEIDNNKIFDMTYSDYRE
jgi:hypothetical protein